MHNEVIASTEFRSVQLSDCQVGDAMAGLLAYGSITLLEPSRDTPVALSSMLSVYSYGHSHGFNHELNLLDDLTVFPFHPERLLKEPSTGVTKE